MNEVKRKARRGGGCVSRLIALVTATSMAFAGLGAGVALAAEPGERGMVSDGGVQERDLNAGTVQGVSPRGTTIDLFDYTAPDINNGHDLEFNEGKSPVLWNSWTGNSSNHGDDNNWNYGYPRTGIVADTLGSDGYPTLSGNTFSGYVNNEQWESKYNQTIDTKSLAYLFDDTTQPGKKAYQDVSGLLQVSEDGYYYYDSQKNFAHFDEDSNGFTLYGKPAVTNGNIHGQFFPFADMNDVSESVEASATLNYHFGVAMETQFMQSDGGRNNGKDVTYEFSGDDDVWVFIDGVLVGDLGGIHDPVSIKIDFSTGAIEVNATGGEDPTANVATRKTLLECFQKAGRDDTTAWSGNTFADGTYHTLNFFYMERGQGASNMSLKYNLVMIPQSEIQKVDQDGNPVPNAGFTLFVADRQYNYNYNNPEPICQGTTDRDGSIILMDGQRHAITLDNIWNQYGGSLGYNAGAGGGNRLNLILKETFTPSGYRSGAGEYRMYLWHVPKAVNGQESTLLLSDNPWTTGAYAQSKVSVTAPNTFTYTEDGQAHTATTAEVLAPGKGTLFAVVEKRSDSTSDDWKIVSGDALNGWKVRDDNDVATAVEVYKSIANTEATTQFELGRSGAYQSVVGNLPGRIQNYTYFAGDGGLYRGAYYYSTDASNVTADTTYRVTDESTKKFGREFSALLYVPNILNRFVVQKVDADGNAIEENVEATFALYNFDNVTCTADGECAPNAGAEPVKTATTRELKMDNDHIDAHNAAVFTDLEPTGEDKPYYLFETGAPAGYDKNTHPVKVYVLDSGVYADAGDKDDGITVQRGVGRIVRSMVQFATDDVDTTLHGIVATPQLWSTTEGKWKDDPKSSKLQLQYADDSINSNTVLDYQPIGGGSRLFSTDTGIPRLMIQQLNSTTVPGTSQDLTNTDITGLFTGTTIVQVSDKTIGSLKISKTVTGANAPQGQTFTFNIELRDSDNAAVSGTFTYGVYTADDNQPVGGSKSDITFTNGQAPITLQDGQYAVIENLPQGTDYTVTEEKAAGYIPHNTVNRIESSDGSIAAGSMDGHDTNPTRQVGSDGWEPNQTVAFTNKYAPSVTASFTIAKQIEGRDWLPDDTFSFLVGMSEDYGDAVTMPTDDNGTMLGTETNPVVIDTDTDGHKAVYGDITFTRTGTYRFTVTEVPGKAEGMTYSDAKFTVTVGVGDLADEPTVTIDRTAGSDTDGGVDGATMTFINTTASDPDGGDPSDPDGQEPAVTPLSFTKVGEGNAPLKDVRFTIMVAEGHEGDTPAIPADYVTTVKSDGNGVVSFAGLADGHYTIAETENPNEGYLDTGLSFTVRIKTTRNPDGTAIRSVTVVDESESKLPLGVGYGLVTTDDRGNITVRNIRGITQLPATGTAGTMLFAALGLLGAGMLAYTASRTVGRSRHGRHGRPIR